MIADNIRALMEQRGLTQTELAARAGLTQPAISKILSNPNARLYFETGLALADALRVDPRLLTAPPAPRPARRGKSTQ
jgi:transcriptional regulator with XRE-family HTH domain